MPTMGDLYGAGPNVAQMMINTSVDVSNGGSAPPLPHPGAVLRPPPMSLGPLMQPPSRTGTLMSDRDYCAGCSVTGMQLLTCDDFEGNSGERARFCPNCMIGKKVRVFWPVDNKWYMGDVEKYDASVGEHLLRYDDDDTEWVKIGESNTTAPQEDGGHGVPPGVHLMAPIARTTSPTHASRQDQASPVSPSEEPISHLRDSPLMPPHPGHAPYSQDQATVSPESKWHPQGAYSPYHGAPVGPPGVYSHSIGYHSAHQNPYPGYHQQPGPHSPTPGAPFPYGASGGFGMGQEQISSSNIQSSPTSSVNGKRKHGPKAWSKDEDTLLLTIVQSMRMPMKWSVVANSLPDRTGKQCRERYVNHLNPRLKVSDWTPIEDATIFHLFNTIGSHWAKMSKMIPGRTDNGIKNRYHNLRRQLEREDEHRLRLSTAKDFPKEIRIERLREFPEKLKGKTANLWNINSGIGVLAGQSILVGNHSRNLGRYGPYRSASIGEQCVRCAFLVPSVHTGNKICTKTGWCQACVKIPPHVSGAMLRECLNLRRCQEKSNREVIESWEDP